MLDSGERDLAAGLTALSHYRRLRPVAREVRAAPAEFLNFRSPERGQGKDSSPG